MQKVPQTPFPERQGPTDIVFPIKYRSFSRKNSTRVAGKSVFAEDPPRTLPPAADVPGELIGIDHRSISLRLRTESMGRAINGTRDALGTVTIIYFGREM